MISLQSAFSEVPLCTKELHKDSYPLFLTTNEKKQRKTLNFLKTEPVTGNTVMGVSGFSLLNMAAVRGIDLLDTDNRSIDTIILVDRAQSVEKFWKEFELIMKVSPNRQTFCQKFSHSLSEKCQEYWKESRAKDRAIKANRCVLNEIARGLSWLSSDSSFLRIKEIFDRGRFIFLKIDLMDRSSTDALHSVLKENALVVDTFYISNVHEHVVRRNSDPEDEIEKREHSFFKGIENLVNPETKIVLVRTRDCPTLECSKSQSFTRKSKKSMQKIFSHTPVERCKMHASLLSISEEQFESSGEEELFFSP